MYMAIITRYLGATANKGARIRVKTDGRSMYVPYDSGMSEPDNHRYAMLCLVKVLGWSAVNWEGGELPDHNGYAFVKVVDVRKLQD